jgi:hypothetical protein
VDFGGIVRQRVDDVKTVYSSRMMVSWQKLSEVG